MTNPVFTYNGKLIREMGNNELMTAFVSTLSDFLIHGRNGDVNSAIDAQILLRMSRDLSDDLGHCQHCGETYCLSCAKPFGADENFCSRDCRDEEMPKREISRAEGMDLERARAANVD